MTLYREFTDNADLPDYGLLAVEMRNPNDKPRIRLVPIEPCKHGNYAKHIINGTATLNQRFGEWFVAAESWCDGKSEAGLEDTT